MKYQDIIKSKGLKQIWVAKQVGVTNKTLSKYLTGVRNMPIQVEEKLIKLLK